MVDFREYLAISEGIDNEDFYDDDEFYDDDSFIFEPIDLGEYILHLYANDEALCSPKINSNDPYVYDAWEVMVEKKHPLYDKVIVTHLIFNKLGYQSFDDGDIYAAFVPNDLVQEVFNYLLDSIKLPKFSDIDPTKKKRVDKNK
jgi:hypothetical protein